MNNFEIATKKKLRFKTTRGLATVEDMWDFSMQELKSVYKYYKEELKEAGADEDKLFDELVDVDPTIEIRLDIIKTIVNEKKAEKLARLTEKEKKEERQQLMQILADKKKESLKNLSVEELEKKIAELG